MSDIELPIELIVEIAKCNWRIYSALLTASKRVHQDLGAINPWVCFINHDKNTDEVVLCARNWRHVRVRKWFTDDGVEVYRSIDSRVDGVSIYIFGEKNCQIDVFSLAYVGDNVGYYFHKTINRKRCSWFVSKETALSALSKGEFWKITSPGAKW
jgi:rhodanese-related sulfurtransferase